MFERKHGRALGDIMNFGTQAMAYNCVVDTGQQSTNNIEIISADTKSSKMVKQEPNINHENMSKKEKSNYSRGSKIRNSIKGLTLDDPTEKPPHPPKPRVKDDSSIGKVKPQYDRRSSRFRSASSIEFSYRPGSSPERSKNNNPQYGGNNKENAIDPRQFLAMNTITGDVDIQTLVSSRKLTNSKVPKKEKHTDNEADPGVSDKPPIPLPRKQKELRKQQESETQIKQTKLLEQFNDLPNTRRTDSRGRSVSDLGFKSNLHQNVPRTLAMLQNPIFRRVIAKQFGLDPSSNPEELQKAVDAKVQRNLGNSNGLSMSTHNLSELGFDKMPLRGTRSLSSSFDCTRSTPLSRTTSLDHGLNWSETDNGTQHTWDEESILGDTHATEIASGDSTNVSRSHEIQSSKENIASASPSSSLDSGMVRLRRKPRKIPSYHEFKNMRRGLGTGRTRPASTSFEVLSVNTIQEEDEPVPPSMRQRASSTAADFTNRSSKDLSTDLSEEQETLSSDVLAQDDTLNLISNGAHGDIKNNSTSSDTNKRKIIHSVSDSIISDSTESSQEYILSKPGVSSSNNDNKITSLNNKTKVNGPASELFTPAERKSKSDRKSDICDTNDVSKNNGKVKSSQRANTSDYTSVSVKRSSRPPLSGRVRNRSSRSTVLSEGLWDGTPIEVPVPEEYRDEQTTSPVTEDEPTVNRSVSDVSDKRAEGERTRTARSRGRKPYRSDPLGGRNRKSIKNLMIDSGILEESLPSTSSLGTSAETVSSQTLSSRSIDSFDDSSENATVERVDSGVGRETSDPRGRISPQGPLCWDCNKPLSDLPLPEGCTAQTAFICLKCEKRKAERKDIILEIVSTEKSYGQDLKIIKEEFYEPMKNNGLLTSEQLAVVFNNLLELISINTHFSEQLEDAKDLATEQGDEEFSTVNIGKLFLEAKTMLLAYESYCIHHSAAPTLIDQLEKEKELLRIFLDVSQKENSVLRKMNLKSFLMVPVQRITKYPLLLKRLYKVTPPGHEDREAMRKAQKMIEDILEHINVKTMGTASMRMRKKISAMLLKYAATFENIELNKVATDVLGWKRSETKILLSGRLMYSPQQDYMSRKGRPPKYYPIYCVIALLGAKNTSSIEPSSHKRLLFPNKDDTVRQAALVLVKEKTGRYTSLRDPLFLDQVVVTEETEDPEAFEVSELFKDSYLLKGEAPADTQYWREQLLKYTLDLGKWRRRRNALPNIMIQNLGHT